MIRVLLADDQSLMRGGFRALLDAEDDMEVVAEAGDGEAAVAEAVRVLPDVALVDVQMPVCDGIEAARRMAADVRLSGLRVVMLTNYGFDEYVYEALRAGASGFLVKDIEPEDLVAGVRTAARGEALLSPGVLRGLISQYVSRPRLRSGALQTLTPREREVVALVAQGLSNDEVAGRLVISPMTAKTHVSRSMVKLACRDRAQLVVVAFESGLVSPGGV